MTMNKGNQQTGQRGEDQAVRYLQRKGWTILDRNWRAAGAEIDIIAQDGDNLVFVEVRTRRAVSTGTALESITPSKREKMVRAAYAYLQTLEEEPLWRIDVIAVAYLPNGSSQIAHVEDALDW